MAYTTIDKPQLYFEPVLYTGNGASTPSGSGSTQTISSLDFAPNLVWIKDRTQSGHNHNLADIIRGAPNLLFSDADNAQITDSTDGFTGFTSNGFTLGDNGEGTQSLELNKSGNNYVSYNWAGGGSPSSNSDGSITSNVSANTTAGFSIVTWTGTGSTATIGHGLGSTPKWILIKSVTGASGWRVYHAGLGATKAVFLSTNAVADDDNRYFNDTEPTSNVFTVRENSTNDNTATMIAYCWAEKKGFSKFGVYRANADSGGNGTFFHCGFKPSLVIVQNTSFAQGWFMMDSKRSTFNEVTKGLSPNTSSAEQDSSANVGCDFTASGFKVRAVGTGDINYGSSHDYIVMAFAESPFVTSTGIPTTAR